MNVGLEKVFRKMNLKERGITVGDLLVLIIISSSIFVFLKVKKPQNNNAANFETIYTKNFYNFEIYERIL